MTTEHPSKKSKKLFIVLGIIAAMAALFVILAAVGIFLGVKAVSAPSDAAKEWLTLIEAGQVDQAYEATSNDFQASTSREMMTDFLAAYPVLAQHTSVSFNSFNIEDDIAVVSGTIVGAGETSPITVTLIREDDAWKVIELSLNPEDVPASSTDDSF